MGASGWHYFVPYQEDAAQALAHLHWHLLAEGDYFESWAYDCIRYRFQARLSDAWEPLHRSWMEVAAHAQNWEGFVQAVMQELASVLEAKHIDVVLPKPATMEELLRRYSQGTHSILDVRRVADQPALYVATPLSQEELVTVLGTEKPTRARTELVLDTRPKPGERSLYTIRGRWQAVYFTVYKDDTPDEICFCGLSGD